MGGPVCVSPPISGKIRCIFWAWAIAPARAAAEPSACGLCPNAISGAATSSTVTAKLATTNNCIARRPKIETPIEVLRSPSGRRPLGPTYRLIAGQKRAWQNRVNRICRRCNSDVKSPETGDPGEDAYGGDLMRHRILVVAQDVTLRSALARWLAAAGYLVELAENHRRARQLLATQRMAL